MITERRLYGKYFLAFSILFTTGTISWVSCWQAVCERHCIVSAGILERTPAATAAARRRRQLEAVGKSAR
jgi:hypothetical protein